MKRSDLTLYSATSWDLAARQESMIADSKDISHMRWELRSTSCLLSLDLGEHYVATLLVIKPELTRLKNLTLAQFAYSNEHIQQLLYLTSLRALQVWLSLPCLAYLPAIYL